MPDPQMVPMMRRLKAEGIQTFLLTNSLWDYTTVVMNYLFAGEDVVAKGGKRTEEWLELFDLVIVGACKVSVLLLEPCYCIATAAATSSFETSCGIEHGCGCCCCQSAA
jgi:5' nucleotidase family